VLAQPEQLAELHKAANSGQSAVYSGWSEARVNHVRLIASYNPVCGPGIGCNDTFDGVWSPRRQTFEVLTVRTHRFGFLLT